MPDYVLDHHNQGEGERLTLMSQLLDPMHRRYVEHLGIGAGARTLEVGCGNGTMSRWLARRVAPDSTAMAVDLDLSLIEADVPNMALVRGDIVAGPVAPGDFDLVTARAVLHHIADVRTAVENLVSSARPGGAILLIEPDFLPVSVAEPPEIKAFWDGWLAWSRQQGIDYFIGRRLPATLADLGLDGIVATAETALYNGGSEWARYWRLTIIELRDRLIAEGKLDSQLVDAFLARCADRSWWTQTIAFTAVHAHTPAS